MRARFDALGRLVELDDGVQRHSAPEGGALHELVLYEDRPRRWEAWDTDREYLEKPTPVRTRCVVRTGVRGDEAWLRTERRLGRASRIVQEHVLRAGERMLRIRTRLEWREERTLLRALFRTGIESRTARFGTQFGWIDRDMHENTSWQRAQFEVPGHDWMAVHDGSRGLAVLDDGIFGKSAREGTLGLSVAKSPNFPDPNADRGMHECEYAIMPLHAHERCASAAAERLNRPMRAVPPAGRRASRGGEGTLPGFVRVDAAGHLEISALKPADDGSGDVILRIVDHSGAPGRALLGFEAPVRSVTRCDLHEAALRGPGAKVALRGGAASVTHGPFEIVSLRIRRSRSR